MDGWSVGVTYVCIWGTPAVESRNEFIDDIQGREGAKRGLPHNGLLATCVGALALRMFTIAPAVESEVTRGYCGQGREFIDGCLDKILEYKIKSINIFICKNP